MLAHSFQLMMLKICMRIEWNSRASSFWNVVNFNLHHTFGTDINFRFVMRTPLSLMRLFK